MTKRPANLQKAFDLGAQSKRAGLGRDRFETNFSWMFNEAEKTAWHEGWQWQYDEYRKGE